MPNFIVRSQNFEEQRITSVYEVTDGVEVAIWEGPARECYKYAEELNAKSARKSASLAN